MRLEPREPHLEAPKAGKRSWDTPGYGNWTNWPSRAGCDCQPQSTRSLTASIGGFSSEVMDAKHQIYTGR